MHTTHHVVQQEVGAGAGGVPVPREGRGAVRGGVHRLEQRAAKAKALQVRRDRLPAMQFRARVWMVPSLRRGLCSINADRHSSQASNKLM